MVIYLFIYLLFSVIIIPTGQTGALAWPYGWQFNKSLCGKCGSYTEFCGGYTQFGGGYAKEMWRLYYTTPIAMSHQLRFWLKLDCDKIPNFHA